MRLIFFDCDYALLVFHEEGFGPLIALCQDDLDLYEDIQDFRESGGDWRHFPIATLQRGDNYWAKSLTKHEFYSIEENVETIFEQHICFEQGIVSKWEIRATGRGDLIYLSVGEVVENFKEWNLQNHDSDGQEVSPREFVLPRWSFIDAYERALVYLDNHQQKKS